jgi:uncharacterized protein YbbC (DUF1343 family)
VTDPETFRPVLTGLSLLAALRQTSERLAWFEEHFDRLAGSPHLREAIEAGTPPAEIAAGWRAYEAAFRERVAPVLLYPE